MCTPMVDTSAPYCQGARLLATTRARLSRDGASYHTDCSRPTEDEHLSASIIGPRRPARPSFDSDGVTRRKFGECRWRVHSWHATAPAPATRGRVCSPKPPG